MTEEHVGKHAGGLNPDLEREADILSNYGIEKRGAEHVRVAIPQPLVEVIERRRQVIRELDKATDGRTLDAAILRRDYEGRLKQELFSLTRVVGMCLNCTNPVNVPGALICDEHIRQNQQFINDHHHGGA